MSGTQIGNKETWSAVLGTCRSSEMDSEEPGVKSNSSTVSHDSVIRQHFRSTLPYWEQIYADGTTYSRIYQERARRAIAYLDDVNLSSGAPVLEVGCGPGVMTTAMAQKGVTVSAIDNVPEMIERTTAKARQCGLESRVFARVGNVESL